MSWTAIFRPLLGSLLEKLVDRIPDPNERARAKEEFELKILAAVEAADQSQAEINKIEAGSQSLFVAGWRPFIGWVCGFGIAWSFVVEPLLTWIAVTWQVTELESLPALDTGPLMSLVLAMLGIGGLRTMEKIKGVARNVSPLAKGGES
jgi:hypothetical protein